MRTRRRLSWPVRGLLLLLGIGLGVLAGSMLRPQRFALAAEDDMDTKIRDESRPEAPGLEGAVAWINTDKPLTMADLKGKVVLLDFWTFG